MATKLLDRIRGEEGVGESSMAERGSEKGRGLKDERGDRKEMGMGTKSERNGAELRSEREPSNSTMRKENMTAGASSGGGFDAGVVRRKTTKRSKAKWKIGKGGLHRKRFSKRNRRRERHRDNGGYMGNTFQGVVGAKNGGIIGGRPSSAIGCVKLECEGEMLGDERMVEAASKAINISHHACRPMKHLEEVAEELLSPATDLVDGSIVFEDLFDCCTITEPEEFGSPKKLAVLADAPATTTSFTNKGVVMTLSFSAAAGAKANRSEAGAFHGYIKVADAVRAEKSKGNFGSIGVVWLHQDPTHAETGPIGLEETRLRRIITSETRRGSNTDFQFVPKGSERWGPKGGRDRLAMMLAFEESQRLDTNFEEWAIYVVEGEEANEGCQRRAGTGKWPVSDQIKFRLSGTVAIGGDVMANILDAISEELALFQLEGNTILREDIADTFE
jgi:hypothetical protein